MKTIFLEFERTSTGLLAALGTDVTFYRDGRWSEATFHRKCLERAEELLTRRGWEGLRLVGYTMPGHDGVRPIR